MNTQRIPCRQPKRSQGASSPRQWSGNNGPGSISGRESRPEQIEMRGGPEVQGPTANPVEISGVHSCGPVDLAKTLRALADPIRLRMLYLMFCGAFCPAQIAQALGVNKKTICRHLEYFVGDELVTIQCQRKTKYYEIRKDIDLKRTGLVSLIVQMFEHNTTISADLAAIKLLCKERPDAPFADEPLHLDSAPNCALSRPASSAAPSGPDSIWAGTGRD